jgi:hypothetical protein
MILLYLPSALCMGGVAEIEEGREEEEEEVAEEDSFKDEEEYRA